jgi:hypothetical protein
MVAQIPSFVTGGSLRSGRSRPLELGLLDVPCAQTAGLSGCSSGFHSGDS